ncbi:hypothetical protein L6452_22022 [Arctium lappa]|uniref:Uncharacterized protein n=1 Tax=Arctium lappa TaxID=4217 RepID=A0ACB9AYN5_ARCLA|nr:hypothetical protein L6452_22022 [Arctium lappa]
MKNKVATVARGKALPLRCHLLVRRALLAENFKSRLWFNNALVQKCSGLLTCTIERVNKDRKVGEVMEVKPNWVIEKENGFEKLTGKVEVLESTIRDLESRLKEALHAQKVEILNQIRDYVGQTTGLSGNSHKNTTLKEENARLKQELEELRARNRTGPCTRCNNWV